MCVDRVRPRTLGSQGQEVTRNTRIEKIVKHKVNEAPTLTPTWIK